MNEMKTDSLDKTLVQRVGDLLICPQKYESSHTDPAHTRNETCKQPDTDTNRCIISCAIHVVHITYTYTSISYLST